MSYPKRYVPKRLTRKDKRKQKREISKSRKAYKKGKYYTRKKVKSFKSKESAHVTKAKKVYGVKNISANANLAKKTGCSISALRKIIKKGQGAYYSSGSRPNQTGHSWGRARLASSITGGKAAAVDFNILESGCKSGSKALRLAKSARRRHGFGTRRVPKHKGGSPASMFEGSEDNDDDRYIDEPEPQPEPTEEEQQAVDEIKSFINSPLMNSLNNMDLENQRDAIQVKMARVVRNTVPILSNSNNEIYRGVGNTFNETYNRLLGQIEAENKNEYMMSQLQGGRRRKVKGGTGSVAMVMVEQGKQSKKMMDKAAVNKLRQKLVTYPPQKSRKTYKSSMSSIQEGGKRKTRKNRSTKMHEKILRFERGPGEKKYTAYIKDNKTGKVRMLHFGHKDYEQFKDRTKNGLYSSRNHGNKKRQRNYYNRHSGEKNRKKDIEKEKRKGNGYYTPKLLSHI